MTGTLDELAGAVNDEHDAESAVKNRCRRFAGTSAPSSTRRRRTATPNNGRGDGRTRSERHFHLVPLSSPTMPDRGVTDAKGVCVLVSNCAGVARRGIGIEGAPLQPVNGGYERPVASLYRRSTSTGMRPPPGTAIPCSMAQARINLGSRLATAERDVDAFLGRS